MPEAMPTVKIVNPDNSEEWLIINESDYNADEMTLWEDKDSAPKKPRADKDTPKEGASADKKPIDPPAAHRTSVSSDPRGPFGKKE